jgi:hypothetical protein
MKLTAMRCVCLAIAAAATSMGLAQGAFAQSNSDFDLVCAGTGEKLESQTDYDWDRKHHEYDAHNRLSKAQVGGTAQVEIHDGQGRVRLPKSLLPPLNSGSGDGWFPIHDLVVAPDRITGSLKLNGLNKPGLAIDRRSGRLTIDGLESFDGTCNAFNPGARRF